MIRSAEDTQYFDDEEPVTDFSDSDDDDNNEELSGPDTSGPRVNVNSGAGRGGADDGASKAQLLANPAFPPVLPVRNAHLLTPPASNPSSPARVDVHDAKAAIITPLAIIPAASANKKRVARDAHLAEALDGFDRNIQQAVQSWLALPYDTVRLRNFELQVDAEPGLRSSERDALKGIVRVYGKKEKKRPRDRLLRDPSTKKAVLEERKKTAFLGYDWHRIQGPSHFSGEMTMAGTTEMGKGPLPGLSMSATTGTALGNMGGPGGGGGL